MQMHGRTSWCEELQQKHGLVMSSGCTQNPFAFYAAIGFNVETVTYKNIKFQVWDLGGQTSIRPYWRCYYPNTQAIIYVVDSSDTERIKTSAGEFHAILDEEELKDALILVYANKQVRGTLIAPSLLNSDFAKLAETAAEMKRCKADWLHMDVMVSLPSAIDPPLSNPHHRTGE